MSLGEAFSATALDELTQDVEQNVFAIANCYLDEQTTELLEFDPIRRLYLQI